MCIRDSPCIASTTGFVSPPPGYKPHEGDSGTHPHPELPTLPGCARRHALQLSLIHISFKHQLEQAGLEVTMRVSHGREINAACGQLANTYNKFKKK